MIYIIACGKEKSHHPIKARQMYTGSYFKSCLKYAESQSSDNIYILSAKYGLIELDEIIEPYDMLITDNDAVSVNYVRYQAINDNLLRKDITMLGGKKYVSFVSKIWESVNHPLKGGLFAQISWMSNEVNIVKAKQQMEMWQE